MIEDVLQQNLSGVQQDIDSACARVDRDPDDVSLVAVTKYADWSWVEALAKLHLTFGENRPQQLAEREPMLPQAEWHLIGQLQRNKVKLALQHTAVIHSIDSLKLLNRVATVAEELNLRPRVLLQLNVSGEESKSGFAPDELRSDWDEVVRMHRVVELAGLMTMAPATDDPEAARPTFRKLAALRADFADRSAARAHDLKLTELSMGMSGDFQVAIEEGATMVRVGSRLFQGLEL